MGVPVARYKKIRVQPSRYEGRVWYGSKVVDDQIPSGPAEKGVGIGTILVGWKTTTEYGCLSDVRAMVTPPNNHKSLLTK